MALRRRHTTRVIAALAAAGATLIAIPATSNAAELFYAATPAKQIVSFTSQAPSHILTSVPVNNLATSETIVGMDVRPATNQLYALTSAGRLLVINPVSGAYKVVGTPIAINGSQFGFDFNPVVDRIRITSDTDQDLRVNPDTGDVGATDPTITYLAGDAGTGTNPAITGIGYTASVFGGPVPAATVLYGIDTERNALVRSDAPNASTYATVGALGAGVDPAANVNLDVASDDTLYAAINQQGTAVTKLWKVAPTTGVATPAATFPTLGTPSITALASAGTVVDDTAGPLVAVGNYTVFRSVWLKQGLRFTTACNEACTVTTTLRIGSTVAGSATVSMNAAGTRAPRILLNAAGKALAASSADLNATLTFDNVDLAGNKRQQVTKFLSERNR